MANQASHLIVADKNEQLIKFLLPTIDLHSEWVAVVAFYKALHLVDALLFSDHPCKHGGDHTRRFGVLKSTHKYQHIYRHYRPLYAASCVARYLAHGAEDYSAFNEYLSPDKVKSVILNHHLVQLEKSVRGML